MASLLHGYVCLAESLRGEQWHARTALWRATYAAQLAEAHRDVHTSYRNLVAGRVAAECAR